MKFLALMILLSMGCASNMAPPSVPLAESLGSASCGSGEFRGVGIGKSDGEALNIAHSDLARQINSSLKVSEKYKQSQKVLNGKETLGSEYKSEIVAEANLQNAHDARVLRVERRAGETGTVVCMSRSDAAKPFLERQRLAADSLGMVSKVAASAEHPKRKNEAWRKTQTLWNEFMKIQSLLEGWGVAKADYFDKTGGVYASARSDYQVHCQDTRLHWEDTDSQCSKAAFAELSKRAKIEKSKCLSGLNLKFSCSEKCKSSSFGVECSFEPSLSIESCGGEPYSLLKAKTPATGSDMNNEAKAREKLAENFTRAVFFSEWENEIKEWMPQCAE